MGDSTLKKVKGHGGKTGGDSDHRQFAGFLEETLKESENDESYSSDSSEKSLLQKLKEEEDEESCYGHYRQGLRLYLSGEGRSSEKSMVVDFQSQPPPPPPPHPPMIRRSLRLQGEGRSSEKNMVVDFSSPTSSFSSSSSSDDEEKPTAAR